MAGVVRDWSVGSGSARLGGWVSDDVVPQAFPLDPPWPVRWQVQHRFAGGRGEAGGHVDQVAAQGGAARDGVLAAGERPGDARSKLCAITAQASQAQFAANSPDGI